MYAVSLYLIQHVIHAINYQQGGNLSATRWYVTVPLLYPHERFSKKLCFE